MNMGISNGLNQKIVIAIIGVLIVIGAVYYFGGYNYGSPAPTPGPGQVFINNFAFNPAVVDAKIGDTITWTNNDSAAHDISGNGFKSPLMSNGQSFSFTFNTAGTYDYICGIHPGMKGAIIVK